MSAYVLILPEVGYAVWVDRWRCLVGIEDENAMVNWASYESGAPIVVERAQISGGMEAEVKRRERELDRPIWS